MSGQMVENTTVNGWIITCTVKVSTHGKMEGDTMANTKMIASTDTVSTPGMMANNMLVGGKMENSTVRVLIAKTAVIARVSGKMERE